MKELDDWDMKILFVLASKGDMHFNKLLKTMEDLKILSKPTLLEHLPHLLNSGYVVCEEKKILVKGKEFMGNVYSVDFDSYRNVKSYVESEARINNLLARNMKKFWGLPINEQIQTVLEILYFRRLSEFKARIAFELNPESLENQFGVLFWSRYELSPTEVDMLKKCVDDSVYREKFLKVVDASLKY